MTKHRRKAPLPPLLFLGCLGLTSIVQFRWPRAIAAYPARACMIGGAALLFVAALFGGSALALMLRKGTPVEPGQVPSQLVTSGPFRVTRNPLYLTLVTVHAVIGLMLNSIWVLTGSAVLLLLLDRVVVQAEEQLIGASSFGDEYEQYRRRVRRWI